MNCNALYLAYLEERYGQEEFASKTLGQMAQEFEAIQAANRRLIFKFSEGFVVYSLEGDAVILFDLYITPQARRNKKAAQIADTLTALGQTYGKRVLMTFSEHMGKNQELGQKAIQFYNFKPAYELANATVYIKGI